MFRELFFKFSLLLDLIADESELEPDAAKFYAMKDRNIEQYQDEILKTKTEIYSSNNENELFFLESYLQELEHKLFEESIKS